MAEPLQLIHLNKRDMKWISVKDKLPENVDHGFSRFVLVSSEMGAMRVDRYDYENKKWLISGTFPSFWMPLPEPPKEQV